MNDLISRQALCDDLREYKLHSVPISSDESEVKGYNDGIDLAISVIAEFPSVESEYKTGKWIENKHMYYCCSECGHEAYWDADCIYQKLFDFCPHCGADMRGE